LVQSLGIAALSKSEVSHLCTSLDTQVLAFRTYRLDAVYPYLWLDARYEKVREVLGLDIGLSEDVVLWREGCFGADSMAGKEFVACSLTVAATCQQHQS
jgi:transposase-like protein